MYRILLDHGGQVDARTSEGAATPLMRACTAGHADVALLLLARRASPTLCDNDGETPLHKAAKEGRADVVGLLLKIPVMPLVKFSRPLTGCMCILLLASRLALPLLRPAAVSDAASLSIKHH